MAEFPKTYSPTEVENKWYAQWLKNKLFNANSDSDKPKYSVLMPPPNVTGILHFGHVLNNTIQDIYIRWKRMQGFEPCWFPGYDHAGIATQSKVEQELRKEGLTRYDLGREEFLNRVWEWKEKYGGIIMKQLRLLGISCDWDRTLFTMDERASNAVRQTFIRLFDAGLIYRGKRIINWSPLARTALSDEEVEFREVKEHLFTLRYWFEDKSGYLCVATVRPETLFGDTAVAVNPNDERYKHLIGKKVIIPAVGRLVPIIADEYADPAFGTGCVKITPAHDPNDFLVGERHNLEQINTINPDGTLNELTGEFNGIERFEARKRILATLKEQDLIEKIEDYTHNVGFSQRGGEAVEPYLSDQWFVSMKPLAEIALKPVLDGEIRFHPSHWVKTYEHWMTNIRDWCISRQLWWGHRIPVYYAEDGRFTAAENELEAAAKLGLPNDTHLEQDPDVLDTWFSSWLWPLTTMGWLADGKTEDNEILRAYHPTDLMVTAPDIIFFWVARMIMASLYFRNEIPFKDVYFTSLIRDGQGRKLSKSLGNSPDPINIIDKYGADAVRFTMVYLSPLGQDVKMDVDVEAQDIPSMEIGRNFANKVWNAGRFLLMKRDAEYEEGETIDYDTILGDKQLSLSDKWILSRKHHTIKAIHESLGEFKINDFSKQAYQFIWSDFCDWYVEIVKIELAQSDDKAYRRALINFAISIYVDILKLLHPIMPFMTEEIFHIISNIKDNESISRSAFPSFDEKLLSPALEDEFETAKALIDEIRSMRANAQIPPQQKLSVVISAENDEACEFFENESAIIASLGKCSAIEVGVAVEKPVNSLASVVRQTGIYILADEGIDLDKERARLQKEIERLERNIAGSEKKLANDSFVAKAPAEVVAFEREKLDSMKASLEKVKENLVSLG